MKVGNKSLWKRALSVLLMFIMALIFSTSPLYESNAKAAEVRAQGEYIKDVRLFIKKGGTAADAQAWCESQGAGWKVFDKSLNSGAAPAGKADTEVFICYTTTTNPDEAVKDLAVMNEKGSYSEAEYQRMLKDQKDSYSDIVKNMKSMLTEYRANYENNKPTAVNAHNYLNAFKDDDSGKLLGDLLLTADDDTIVNVIMQCNGTVFLTMQSQLAAACDTGATTWLDRMARLGSYDKLKTAFSKNMDSGNVTKTLDAQYRDKAFRILEHWDDLHSYFDKARNFDQKVAAMKLSDEEKETWIKNLKPEDPEYAVYNTMLTLNGLAVYGYGDKTLFDFFSKTKGDIEREGIELLYPMAASLTDGQISAMNESVGLYQLIQDAEAATLVNKGKSGVAGDMAKAEDQTALKETDKVVEDINKMVKDVAGSEPVSIYEGVDREVYNGGVAVTTDAKNHSGGSESSWLDPLYDKSKRDKLFAITALSTVGAGLLSGAFYLTTYAMKIRGITNEIASMTYMDTGIAKYRYSDATIAYINDNKIMDASELIARVDKGYEQAKNALDDINRYALNNTSYKFFNALKIGFTVFTVILAVADIAIAAYSIYKHYNVEHIDIPHHMVDLHYSENTEAVYLAYKSVRDQNNNCGDLNGGDGKQWLALYYTKDNKAGDAILAPGDNNEWALVIGDSKMPGTGYTPLHMFETNNVAQNLTFADGDNGYSFNDKNGGTYLYFSHANAVITYTGRGDETVSESKNDGKNNEFTSGASSEPAAVSGSAVGTDQTATALSSGMVALIGAICLVIGGLAGFVIADTRRKKHLKD